MHITSPQRNLGSQGVNPGSLSKSPNALKQESADQKKATSTISNIFLSAAAALGGRLFTGAVKLLRGSSRSFGEFIMQLGSTMLKQLKEMAKSPSSSTPTSKSNLLQGAKAFVEAGHETQTIITDALKVHQEKQTQLLKELQEKYPQKFPSDSSVNASKTPSSKPTGPLYKGPARTAEHDARANDKTIFQDIIKTSFGDPKKAEGAVNFLARKLDGFIDSKIEEAVGNNSAVGDGNTVNEIAQEACSQNRIAPSDDNMKALSNIIERRINVLQKQKDSMVQKLLAQLTKLPVAPGLPPVPTDKIQVPNPTTDPISEKGRVVQNALRALNQMDKKESDSILEKLYNKHSEPLNNKTDAKTVELIGKEYDEQQLVKEFDS
jgi:hypothetical protein